MSFFSALAVIGGVLMGVTVLHWIVAAIQEGARASERERELEELSAIRVRQNHEMLRERTVEDVARDMDAGQF